MRQCAAAVESEVFHSARRLSVTSRTPSLQAHMKVERPNYVLLARLSYGEITNDSLHEHCNLYSSRDVLKFDFKGLEESWVVRVAEG